MPVPFYSRGVRTVETETTMTQGERSELRTDDLAEAAYLNLRGFRHARLEMKDRRSAEWVFVGGQELFDASNEYQDEAALVEPLDFNRVLREVRDELYVFLKNNRA